MQICRRCGNENVSCQRLGSNKRGFRRAEMVLMVFSMTVFSVILRLSHASKYCPIVAVFSFTLRCLQAFIRKNYFCTAYSPLLNTDTLTSNKGFGNGAARAASSCFHHLGRVAHVWF